MKQNQSYYIRPLFFLITAILLFSLSHPSEALAGTKKIGIMWIGRSGMAVKVLHGLTRRLKEIAPNTEIELRAVLKDKEEATLVYKEFERSKDAIVFLRSTGAKYMGKNPPRIPGFFGGCSNPKLLGAITSFQKPNNNITGVSYYLKAKNQLETFKTIFPHISHVGLLIEEGHPSAEIDHKNTQEACQAMNLKYTVKECSSKKDLIEKAKELFTLADLVILGNQALIFDNAELITPISIQTKIPLVAYSQVPIKKHAAICGLVPDDIKLGEMLADSMFEVLEKNKKTYEIPVKLDPSPKIMIALNLVKKLNITIPRDILEKAVKL